MTDPKTKKWQRFNTGNRCVLVRPEMPDWIVLSSAADRTLSNGDESSLAYQTILAQMAGEAPRPYKGRKTELTLDALRECWFHLTNRCNLACGHCLFKASPAHAEAIDPALLTKTIDEAAALGCDIFYFTGGEPFVYPGFCDILDRVLDRESAHAVILTNGLLAPEFLPQLKELPPSRLHFQISIDGREENHDRLRSAGTFARTIKSIEQLCRHGLAVTLSVAVNHGNFRDLEYLVGLAADLGCKNLHLLWHFVRGKGSDAQFVEPEKIMPELIKAQIAAEERGVSIDNVEGLRAQLFSPPSTRYDLSNSGWESLAVGPDGRVFPSPALVDMEELACGNVADGLEKVWRRSPAMKKVRQASLIDHPETAGDPWRFLIGGGDIDHSYIATGNLVGGDPYLPLYRDLALWLIDRAAAAGNAPEHSDILLRMGDLRRNCPDGGRSVSLTHCNCVVSLAADQGRAEVREFYGNAAITPKDEISNPFAEGQKDADFIPAAAKKRSYGCGSPVEAAEIKKGETVVDLGSGSGVECFMAAAAVGPKGKVFGIDMTDDMLAVANEAKKKVTAKLGYDNLEFRKGFLEAIPLKDNCADVVISNCVINLSPDKRATYHEIIRILKPGGRLVVSDVVSDGPVEVAIKNDARFRGECLGGALQQLHLVNMLNNCGFTAVRLLKRFPYRRVSHTDFFSLTYEAIKPGEERKNTGIYRGPFAGVIMDNGEILLKGRTVEFSGPADDSIFLLDDNGGVGNIDMGQSCCGISSGPAIGPPLAPDSSCCNGGGIAAGGPPEENPGCCGGDNNIVPLTISPPERKAHGCMVCGEEIRYSNEERQVNCHFCGRTMKSSAICGRGHFVCDDCHRQDGIAAIRVYCATSDKTDLITMLQEIRSHAAIPMHGPEHHALVPGLIVAAARNSGADIPKEAIMTAIDRGSKVPGGVCGFWGMCGAAAGVGIGFSVILEATPLTARPRQQAQEITARVLNKIAHNAAGRCCQRESSIALKEAAIIADEIMGIKIGADAPLACSQFRDNRECIGARCHLFPVQRSEQAE